MGIDCSAGILLLVRVKESVFTSADGGLVRSEFADLSDLLEGDVDEAHVRVETARGFVRVDVVRLDDALFVSRDITNTGSYKDGTDLETVTWTSLSESVTRFGDDLRAAGLPYAPILVGCHLHVF